MAGLEGGGGKGYPEADGDWEQELAMLVGAIEGGKKLTHRRHACQWC